MMHPSIRTPVLPVRLIPVPVPGPVILWLPVQFTMMLSLDMIIASPAHVRSVISMESLVTFLPQPMTSMSCMMIVLDMDLFSIVEFTIVLLDIVDCLIVEFVTWLPLAIVLLYAVAFVSDDMFIVLRLVVLSVTELDSTALDDMLLHEDVEFTTCEPVTALLFMVDALTFESCMSELEAFTLATLEFVTFRLSPRVSRTVAFRYEQSTAMLPISVTFCSTLP